MDVRRQHELLRDECERLAREAERVALEVWRPDSERFEAIEAAKVYWQMSRDHADTVAAAADVRPVNFTGRNSGPQKKTEKRLAFLKAVATEKGLTSRKAIAGAAANTAGFLDLFPSFDAALSFMNRQKLF